MQSSVSYQSQKSYKILKNYTTPCYIKYPTLDVNSPKKFVFSDANFNNLNDGGRKHRNSSKINVLSDQLLQQKHYPYQKPVMMNSP